MPFPGITLHLVKGEIGEAVAGRCTISAPLVLLTQFKLTAVLSRSPEY